MEDGFGLELGPNEITLVELGDVLDDGPPCSAF